MTLFCLKGIVVLGAAGGLGSEVLKTLKNKSCERGVIGSFYDDVEVYGFSKDELMVNGRSKR